MKKFPKTFCAIIGVLVFIFFFNGGYKSKGPARGKFTKKGFSEEDLVKPEAAPEVDKLKEIATKKNLVEWAKWWQACAPNFNLQSMENLGEFPVDKEPTNFLAANEMKKGPGGMLFIRSPNGKYYINPYWGRLEYLKKEDGWQPYAYYNVSKCGTELLEPSQKSASVVFRCYMFDGLDAAFWIDSNRFVLMGYDGVTRQMSVECETVQSCIAPSIWIVDLKTASMHQYRGAVVKREVCNLGGFAKLKLPKFFGEE